ncbi:very short patch repair endonuclease [Pacificispira spongiicola]|nr:DNA mismatch endonuclease Vsr [Pacificispira spongiicola]
MRSDIVDAATRSRMMAGIRGKDTKPEMIVRRGLHRRGFRFRLHDRSLPGRPDLILPRYHVAIFVHGCFWHGHDCPLFRWPRTREDFWRDKIGRNRERDRNAAERLQEAGWRILTIWECAFRGKTDADHDATLNRAADWIANGATGEAILRGELRGHC